jgi:hypothetical protein
MRRTIIALAAIATLSSAHAAVQTVEADNGAVYRIVEITHGRGGIANASVYSPDGDALNISFDCAGHMVITSMNAQASGPYQSVPPRSVAGRIGQLACGGRQ